MLPRTESGQVGCEAGDRSDRRPLARVWEGEDERPAPVGRSGAVAEIGGMDEVGPHHAELMALAEKGRRPPGTPGAALAVRKFRP